jgi:pimeloyl-ACP methyl ester carboxylesterase
MVHGNNSNSDFFRNFDFVQPFIRKAIPYDAGINLPTTNIEANGRNLVRLINEKSRQFGAHSVHLIAHSKGGLNSRHFLTLLPRDCDKDSWQAGNCVGVLSLTTLSTPHDGSAGADYQLDVRRSGLAFAPNRTRFAMARALSINPGTTVTLLNRPGGGGPGINFCNTTLDDDGGLSSIQNINAALAPYTGTFTPASPLAAFRGQNPNGTWRLRVGDFAGGDTGSVRAFSPRPHLRFLSPPRRPSTTCSTKR